MTASVIDPETFDDEWFGSLSDREMLVWIGVFARLRDDQGRFVENAALARARLWPYRDVPIADVQAAFDRFVTDGRLYRYTADSSTLLQIVNWWDHQRPQWAAASKLPSPEGWTDRVRTRQNGKYVDVNWSSPGGFARTVQAKTSGEGSRAKGLGERSRPKPSGEPFGLAREPEPEPEPEPVISTPKVSVSVATEPEPQPSPRRSEKEDLPEVPVTLCGPIRRIVGTTALTDLLTEGTDLNTSVARFLVILDDLADKALAEQPEDRRTEARARCRRVAFDRMAATHAKAAIGNLPAYLTTAARKATVLGDLVGDDLVRELRAPAHGKRAKRADLEQVKAVLPELAQPPGGACSFPVSA